MNTQKKLTKIVATLGPASDSEATISSLIQAGVNVFRFNTKHGNPEWHQVRIKRVQKVADTLGVPIGILIDLQGPELRLETRNQEPVLVSKDEIFTIGSDLAAQDDVNIALPHPSVFSLLSAGDTVLIDDGYLETEVVKVEPNKIYLRPLNSHTLKHRKGVNLPGKHIDLPTLIEADLRQLDMASLNKVDFVALSFVRTPQDIKILRRELKSRGMQAQVVAKIENQIALDNLTEIVSASDAVMVARGDLGIETPIEQLAYWQKRTIYLCRKHNKPVITATQMLESMIQNPRPTRAEATDVANAVLDGTDALMLSAETAAGKHPIQAVTYMARIAAFNEQQASLHTPLSRKPQNTTEQIIEAAVTILSTQKEGNIDAVVVFTQSGYTAKALSAYRLPFPILVATDSPNTVETLTLSYGIIPVLTKFTNDVKKVTPEQVIQQLKAKNFLSAGQTVLVVYGHHWRTPGLTNSLSLIQVS